MRIFHQSSDQVIRQEYRQVVYSTYNDQRNPPTQLNPNGDTMRQCSQVRHLD